MLLYFMDLLYQSATSNTILGNPFTGEHGVAYIPMPKGRGITPHEIKCAMIAQYLLHLYNGNIESNGIQPRYFGVVYTAPQIQRAASCGIQPCYFWVVYTRHRYSVPQSAGRRLSRDYQQTEYSCFHDDHASPQALIPVIPSVLNFFRAPAASGHR